MSVICWQWCLDISLQSTSHLPRYSWHNAKAYRLPSSWADRRLVNTDHNGADQKRVRTDHNYSTIRQTLHIPRCTHLSCRYKKATPRIGSWLSVAEKVRNGPVPLVSGAGRHQAFPKFHFTASSFLLKTWRVWKALNLRPILAGTCSCCLASPAAPPAQPSYSGA